eukprot:3995681-Lingulodinium_polyedra.AAC.1
MQSATRATDNGLLADADATKRNAILFRCCVRLIGVNQANLWYFRCCARVAHDNTNMHAPITT